MKNISVFLAAAILAAALTFGGCRSGNGPVSSAQPSSSPSSQTSSSSSPSVPSSSGTVSLPLSPEALDQLLEEISGFETDTAGSSLKMFLLAAQALDYTERYDPAQRDTHLPSKCAVFHVLLE